MTPRTDLESSAAAEPQLALPFATASGGGNTVPGEPNGPSLRRWVRQDWIMAALLVTATLFVYFPAWWGEPVFDDSDHLTPPELQSLAGLVRIWTEVGVVSQYYPVTHTAFWVEHALWGEAMLPYHLVNILLHAAGALLFVRLLRQLAVPGAWLAGALFALHPVHVESVAWISELKNTLSTVFCLGAALMYLRWAARRPVAHERGGAEPSGRDDGYSYAAALTLFGLGLLSKGVVATLPGALLVLRWWQRGRLGWRDDVQPLLPFFALGIAAGAMTAWVERHFIGADGAAFALGAADRLLIAGRVPWFYLGKLLWPAELVFIYPRWSLAGASAAAWLFPLTTVIAGVALWALRHRARGTVAAGLIFVGTLVPVLGFLNVYPFVYSFVADHYQYLASLSVIAWAAAVIVGRGEQATRSRGRRIAVAGIAAVMVAGCGILTWRQAHQYVNAETLWRETLARNPDCFVAHANLTNVYLAQNEPAEALEHARRAVQLRPDFAETHNNLGNALRAAGDADGALREYQTAAGLRPGLAQAHFNIGAILLERGNADAARQAFEAAVSARPDFVKARVNLGSLLLDAGRTDEARAQLEAAVKIHPADAEAQTNLGNVMLRLGQAASALEHYDRALAADPANPVALFDRGAALLQLDQPEPAASDFAAALRLRPNFAEAQHGLGVARLRQGRTGEAARCFRKALELRPDFAAAKADLDALTTR